MKKKLFLLFIIFQIFSLFAKDFSEIYKKFASTHFSEEGRITFVNEYENYLNQNDTIFMFQETEQIRQIGEIIKEETSEEMTAEELQVFQVNCYKFQELINDSSKIGEKLLTTTIFGLFVLIVLLLISLRYIIHREEKFKKERLRLQIEKAVEETEIRIQSSERQQLYKTLHDSISQNIKAEILFTEQLENSLQKNKDELEKITVIKKLQKDSLNTISGILTLYNPVSVQEGEFDLLVKDFCASFMESTKLKITVLIQNKEIFNALNVQQKDCIYNIIKEALNNIFRHAKAEAASVIFRKDEKNNKNILLICDDGCGFEIQNVDKEKHHGLSIMKSRAMLINADLTVRSNLETGTEIILKL